MHEQIILALEKLEQKPYWKYYETIASEFKSLRDQALNLGDHKTQQLMQYELEVFSLQTNHRYIRHRDSPRRFVPQYTFDNGKIWPDVDEFTKEQIEYYLQRFKNTENVFLKARYGDFLFEHGHALVKKYDIAIVLDPLLLTIAECHAKHSKPFPLGALYCYDRVAFIAISMGNTEMAKTVIEALTKFLQDLKHGEKERWMIEVSGILHGLVKSLVDNDVQSDVSKICKDELRKAKDYFWQKPDHNLHRSICQELIKWESECTQDLRREIGRSYEAEAEHQQGRKEKSGLVAAHFYEHAMKYYSDIGESDDVERMKLQITKAYDDAVKNGEFKRIESSFDLSEDDLESFWLPYLELDNKEDVLSLLALDPRYIISVDRVCAELDTIEPSLVSMVHTSVISGNRKVFQPSSEEERKHHEFIEQYKLTMQLISFGLLPRLIHQLIENGVLTNENLSDYFAKWPLMKANNLAIVEIGFERFFAKDYVSAIHVLVPQFESILRSMFEQGGYITTKVRKGATLHEETLTSFLERDDVRSALGDDLYWYYRIVLVEQSGINLRNDLAHGLISFESCNYVISLLVIHMFVTLTRFIISEEAGEHSETHSCDEE